MVVDNFDVIGVNIFNAETYPPPFVNSDTVLVAAIFSECFDPIRTHLHWVFDAGSVSKSDKPSLGLPLNGLEFLLSRHRRIISCGCWRQS
jgi:hypothetical protein